MRIRLILALYLVCGNTHSADKILIQSVHVDPGGGVHIIETDGRDRDIPKEKDQVGSSQAKIADDKETAGWLAEYENCCTSYPIALTLVVYRRDKDRFGDGMMKRLHLGSDRRAFGQSFAGMGERTRQLAVWRSLVAEEVGLEDEA
jgi:hypothetical protein